MSTGMTAWTGPTGWVTMPATADHSADVINYAAGTWTWSGAPSGVVGSASGPGIFGFTVFKNVTGSQSLGMDDHATLVARVRYRVIVTGPENIADWSLPRLAVELYCLGYATVDPLPHIGSQFFNAQFGASSWGSGLDNSLVRGIQYEPENESDPSVWTITFSVSPEHTGPSSTRPGTGAKSVVTTEEAPWVIGPDVSISFGTEDFVLGLGKFIGAKTPAELDTALENGTYAEAFGATGGTFEMVANSAGDPLESPPPMKVGNATIQITRAFEELPDLIADNVNGAMEQVCSSAIGVNGLTFAAYTCKLSGATITSKRWKKKADWLPKQVHPLDASYSDIGWLPPTGATAGAVAVNYTKNVLPAFSYLPYFEVSISIAQRDLGWGYALVDKGYRDKNKKENTDFPGRQSHVGILAEGVLVDTATGTTDKKVLRLYQVLKTGTKLSDILPVMLEDDII